MIDGRLFETENYYLSAIDYEKDPEIDSQYSLNLRYARYWSDGFPKPLSKHEFKKKYEKVEKRVEETGRVIHFTIRTKADHLLIGFVRINVMWNHAVGWMVIAIGNQDHTEKAPRELMPLILKYSFHELNLFRLEVDVPEFDPLLKVVLEEYGFKLDGTNRGVLYFDNQYWNEFLFGILKPEWQKMQEEKDNA